MTVLQAIALGLPALGAPALVLTRDPLKMVLVNGVYGWTLVLLFVVLQAPDVALSMLVVGTVALPVVILSAIVRIRDEERGRKKREE